MYRHPHAHVHLYSTCTSVSNLLVIISSLETRLGVTCTFFTREEKTWIRGYYTLLMMTNQMYANMYFVACILYMCMWISTHELVNHNVYHEDHVCIALYNAVGLEAQKNSHNQPQRACMYIVHVQTNLVTYMYMSVDVCVLVHVCVCELGALECVGRVG